MNVTGTWRIVSSLDFDDDHLRMEVEPYVELAQAGNRVSGSYHVGLQLGEIDGRIDGEGRVSFTFEEMDELDEVHGWGSCGSRECGRTSCWRITRVTRSPSSASGLHS